MRERGSKQDSGSLLVDRWYKGLGDQPTDKSGRIVPYQKQLHGKPPVTRPTARSFYCAGQQLLGCGTLGKKVASAAATGILDVCPAWRIPKNVTLMFRAVCYASLLVVLAVWETSALADVITTGDVTPGEPITELI